MGKFRIQSHGRLQEWVAEEKGYFKDEGLDYEFLVKPIVTWTADIETVESAPEDIQRGAFESIEDGRGCNVSAACHWTVNMAASAGHGKMWGRAYSVSPSGIFVAPDSPIESPRISPTFRYRRLPLRQSLFDFAGARAVFKARRNQAALRRSAARPLGVARRSAGSRGKPLRRAVLRRRTVGFQKDRRYDVHDRPSGHGARRSQRGRALLRSVAPRAARHRSGTGGVQALFPERTARALSRWWIFAASAPASASSSSRIRKQPSSAPGSGSNRGISFRRNRKAKPATTRRLFKQTLRARLCVLSGKDFCAIKKSGFEEVYRRRQSHGHAKENTFRDCYRSSARTR